MRKNNVPNILIVLVLLLAGLAGFFVSIVMHRPTRIFHKPMQFVAQLQKNPGAGEKIYHEYCAVCHAPVPVIDIGAPRVGYAADWKPYAPGTRMAHLLTGMGAMPARGGCFECSDRLLGQAMDYMLSVQR